MKQIVKAETLKIGDMILIPEFRDIAEDYYQDTIHNIITNKDFITLSLGPGKKPVQIASDKHVWKII